LEKQQTQRNDGDLKEKYLLVTLHRSQHVDDPEKLQQLVRVVNYLSLHYPFKLIFPLHPRTRAAMVARGYRFVTGKLSIVGPQTFAPFYQLLKNAHAVLTDSGGVQEESSYLNVPCVTLRPSTERPITVTNGTNMLSPFDEPERVFEALQRQVAFVAGLAQPIVIDKWDAKAAHRIADHLADYLA
jgi:UDP-N-acetylglucosamine 2-epimerase (non-hydrolysing)